jgi:hypothetical protein
MNNVIQVLELMASDSSFQNEQAVEALLKAAEINTEQSAAVITQDVISLERQLDICPDFYCAFFPAEDDKQEDEDEESTDVETKSIVNI